MERKRAAGAPRVLPWTDHEISEVSAAIHVHPEAKTEHAASSTQYVLQPRATVPHSILRHHKLWHLAVGRLSRYIR